MTTRAEEPMKYPLDQEELRYWARRGTKTAAFLLVIPGSTLIALGAGMLMGQMLPLSVVGLGAGLLIWGLIVALTK
jgi:hypothetical protein